MSLPTGRVIIGLEFIIQSFCPTKDMLTLVDILSNANQVPNARTQLFGDRIACPHRLNYVNDLFDDLFPWKSNFMNV